MEEARLGWLKADVTGAGLSRGEIDTGYSKNNMESSSLTMADEPTETSGGAVSAPEEESIPDDESSENSSGSLPMDTVFQLLSAERRRHVLDYLQNETDTTTTGELAEYIAALENDKAEKMLSSTERKRVYVALYQCHLPKMDDANVISFDKSRGTVTKAENADQLVEHLPEDSQEAALTMSDLTVLTLAVLGAGALAGLALFQSVPWFSGFLVGVLLALAAPRAVRLARSVSRDA